MQSLRWLTRWRNFIELKRENQEIRTVIKASKKKMIIATYGIECIQGQAVKNRVNNQESLTTIIYCEKLFESTLDY